MKVISFLAILVQFTIWQNSSVVVAQYARAKYQKKCGIEFDYQCYKMKQDPKLCKSDRDKIVKSNNYIH